MSSLSLAEGTLFNGRYCVVRCIAMGGMGAVYEVIHKETERRRALKVMLPHLVQSDDMRSRFRQEARIAARIDSEFIVDVFDAGIDEGTGMPFLVMELLQGEELAQTLKRKGRLSPEEAVTYLYQAALALDETHRAHIVHRDLKPANLFLEQRPGRPPRIKVLDFGIAKIVADGATQANATQNLGTPLYMAPEQFQPGGAVTPATDIYALGMVAFTLLVGTAYWKQDFTGNDNLYRLIVSVLQGPSEKATARAARFGVTLPAAFDGWFSQVSAVSPKDRFPSAVQAILALADALGVPAPGLADAGPFARKTLNPSPSDPGAERASQAPAHSAPLETNLGGVASTGAVASVKSQPKLRRVAFAIAIAAGCAGTFAVTLSLMGRDRSNIAVTKPEAALGPVAAALPWKAPEPDSAMAITPLNEPSASPSASVAPAPTAAETGVVARPNAEGAHLRGSAHNAGQSSAPPAASALSKAAVRPAAPQSRASATARPGSEPIYRRD